MIRAFISSVLRLICVLSFLSLIGLGYVKMMLPEPHTSAFTHDEVAEINPILIVDTYTLVYPDSFKATMTEAFSRLVSMGVVQPTPLGPMVSLGRGHALNLIIQSGGGKVALGKELEASVESLKQAGYKIHCYIGEAQSMAFYLTVSLCDKVIAKKSATFMQHKVSYGVQGTTPSTFMMDVELSRRESQVLSVSYDEWHDLVRGEEDHVFTNEELDKYKIVDEWVD